MAQVGGRARRGGAAWGLKVRAWMGGGRQRARTAIDSTGGLRVLGTLPETFPGPGPPSGAAPSDTSAQYWQAIKLNRCPSALAHAGAEEASPAAMSGDGLPQFLRVLPSGDVSITCHVKAGAKARRSLGPSAKPSQCEP